MARPIVDWLRVASAALLLIVGSAMAVAVARVLVRAGLRGDEEDLLVFLFAVPGALEALLTGVVAVNWAAGEARASSRSARMLRVLARVLAVPVVLLGLGALAGMATQGTGALLAALGRPFWVGLWLGPVGAVLVLIRPGPIPTAGGRGLAAAALLCLGLYPAFCLYVFQSVSGLLAPLFGALVVAEAALLCCAPATARVAQPSEARTEEVVPS